MDTLYVGFGVIGWCEVATTSDYTVISNGLGGLCLPCLQVRWLLTPGGSLHLLRMGPVVVLWTDVCI